MIELACNNFNETNWFLYFFTEENIGHITRDLFVAGSENVAIGILWLLGYMTKYREVQDKCRKCITEVRISCVSLGSLSVNGEF